VTTEITRNDWAWSRARISPVSAEYAESCPEKISHEERATWRGVGVHRGVGVSVAGATGLGVRWDGFDFVHEHELLDYDA
jgi:hypothetical protein